MRKPKSIFFQGPNQNPPLIPPRISIPHQNPQIPPNLPAHVSNLVFLSSGLLDVVAPSISCNLLPKLQDLVLELRDLKVGEGLVEMDGLGHDIGNLE
ncbi:hypothetical protein COP2_037331 [Malus domestica]